METSKLLFRGFSVFQFIWLLVSRLIAVIAIIISYQHFDENRVVISIFISLCLLFILFIGDEQINVYSDKVVHSNNSIVSLIFKSKGKVYKMTEIKRAYLPPATSVSAPAVGFSVMLAMLLPKNTSNNSYPVFLDMVNGETIRIETWLEAGQLKRMVQVINSLK